MFAFPAQQPTVAQIIASMRNLGSLISSNIYNYAEIALTVVQIAHSWIIACVQRSQPQS